MNQVLVRLFRRAVLIAAMAMTAGCSMFATSGEGWKTHSVGERTPGRHVPPVEYAAPGFFFSWSTDGGYTPGTGTISGPEVRNGKIGWRYEKTGAQPPRRR